MSAESDKKDTPLPEDVAEAEKYKNEANDCFKSKFIWINLISGNTWHALKCFKSSIKTERNTLNLFIFLEQDFNKAIDLYTKAIDKNPNAAVYYANRSFAYLKTECFGYALTDASKSVELDKNYVKAFYRRAAAYMSLGKFKEALKDFEYVSISHQSIR